MGQVRRKFTEEYKREAVRFLEETGRPLRAVAEELDGVVYRVDRFQYPNYRTFTASVEIEF